ncbi:alpha-L-fucosidase [Bacteroidales bacterium OttesenSCG-928-B11]|nr:alpha-L-fucosidase [Bacteroidales bacterium OttesenSCG-928-B11]MDL2325911.1 alpha-L-fucosidase [Bacteroidales bacterium OttesenSCG-928-A14]
MIKTIFFKLHLRSVRLASPVRYLAFFAIIVFAFTFCACDKTLPPEPFGAIPSQELVDWHKMEYYMFVHFGPNTFTNVEWGDGKEDPNVFNPTDLDCRQWAETAKNAGMRGIILTAKHHDGFCLWPSNYSTHTVRESLWKNGEGDVLKELSEACKEYGLQFGLYVSPWDRNHPTYGTEEYNEIFVKTLEEVLANYGDQFEIWFDGANGEGKNGKKQVYDWNTFHTTVCKYQPKAIHAIEVNGIGSSCRWVGNEQGVAGKTNWCTLNNPSERTMEILGVGEQGGGFWIPAETDVSIRPGWFYSPETNDKVKSVEKLMDIYYTSVGRNSNLLLNVPPDTRGRIHPADSIRLMEFYHARNELFAENIAEKAIITASNVRGKSPEYSAMNLLDDDYDRYWAADDDILTASLEIDLSQEKEINHILLQEYIPLGQRIVKFSIAYWDNGWHNIVNETTIGYKRIVRFPTIKTSKIKINIEESLACPVLNRVEIYYSNVYTNETN